MITLVEAKHFRCLRYIKQHLGPFHVLSGPNGSGKTAFLDVIAFLGRLVSEGLDAAVFERTPNFQDLVWMRANRGFELALEAGIPKNLRQLLRNPHFNTVRYEVAIEMDAASNTIMIAKEKVLLKTLPSSHSQKMPRQSLLFPVEPAEPRTIITPARTRETQIVANKVPGGNDNFYSEVYKKSGKGWAPSFKLGPQRSVLGNLLADEKNFPVSTWLKDLLGRGVKRLIPNNMLIRKTSPPGQGNGLKPDGSNLAWAVLHLQKKHPERFQDWVTHLKSALPDLADIGSVERKTDKHRYLLLTSQNGLKIPSWLASDGTLRLFTLTLPAYLTDAANIYLIENPENGMHPRAVEAMFQTLSSVHHAQILLATHSPAILSMTDAENVFCFARTDHGETDIVIASRHPALKEQHAETNLEKLFVEGVLG